VQEIVASACSSLPALRWLCPFLRGQKRHKDNIVINHYECIAIVRQDVSSTQAEQLGREIEEILKENGGTILKQENWGLRPFAYRIRKNRKGHYLYFEVDMDGAAITEIERRLTLHEDLLRHIVVKVENFIEGPSAMLLSKQREERAAAESSYPSTGGYGGSRDDGYRPRARYQEDSAA
jgi:small subunit ribosomal protein S6